jgi:hypothetical protein
MIVMSYKIRSQKVVVFVCPQLYIPGLTTLVFTTVRDSNMSSGASSRVTLPLVSEY